MPLGRRCLLARGCACPVCPGAYRCACLAVAEAPAGLHLPGSSGRSLGCRYLGARASADSVSLFQQVRPKPNNWSRDASTRRCPSCSRRGQPPRPEQARPREACSLASVVEGWSRRIPGLDCPSAEASGWSFCRARFARLPKQSSGSRVPFLRLTPKRRGLSRLLVPVWVPKRPSQI
jgi:hypothetical protein